MYNPIVWLLKLQIKKKSINPAPDFLNTNNSNKGKTPYHAMADEDEEFVYDDSEDVAADPATDAVNTLAITLGVKAETALGALLKTKWNMYSAGNAIADGFSVAPAVIANTRICSVCLDDDVAVFGTTLCSHSACAACWRAHMLRTSKRGVELQCFGATESSACCDKAVSLAVTVDGVSPLPLLDVVKRDFAVQTQSDAALTCRVCSEPLVLLENAKALCMKCGGDAICVQCRSTHHAPATCDSMRRWDVLVAQHEAVLTSRYCKPCPRCRIVIERVAGCDFMHHEVCGAKFCWKCLESWDDGAAHVSCTSAALHVDKAFVICNDNVRRYLLQRNVKFVTELDRSEITAEALNELFNAAVDGACVDIVLRAVQDMRDVYWLLACACIDAYFYRASSGKLAQLEAFNNDVAALNEFLTLIPAQIRSMPDTIPDVACTLKMLLCNLARARCDVFATY